MSEEHDKDYGADSSSDDAKNRIRERLEGLLPGALRRTVSTAETARQYTEDVLRGALGEIKLPKEVLTTILDTVDSTKKEVVRVAAREFREFLDSARFNEELARILTQLSLEIRTEIRFIPNDQALKPSVTTHAEIHTGSGESISADKVVAEPVNEAVRGHASELVELILMRVLRGKDAKEEAGEAAAEEGDSKATADSAGKKAGETVPKAAKAAAKSAEEPAEKPAATRKAPAKKGDKQSTARKAGTKSTPTKKASTSSRKTQTSPAKDA